MPEVRASGCTPEPLMGYLKALGLFRLVAEQADPAARGWWHGEAFVLDSRLGREELCNFFLRRYRPTPILAPWNGGSGFYGGGAEPLGRIAGSSADRLGPYRRAIAAARTFVPADKPKDQDKERLLGRCRAELEDEIVPWLDTCFILGEKGAGYFPLLGTGGNDGRLDFTNNFMQRLGDVIGFGADEPLTGESARWLSSALFGEGLEPLGKASVGQFNPGGIGGANGVQGKFEADSRVNPWDFVLMIEGALLFAGAVARRLGSEARDRPVFPFTVASVAVGYGSAAGNEETSDGSRAELWLPLWDSRASLAEVVHLFGEGRAQYGRRQARNAVEFALAVCTLGVARGIESFARYGFLKRNGLAYLAAPLGRIAVRPRPRARLLEDPPLSDWLERLRRACREKDKTPARYQSALRGIDRALFEFANRAQVDEAGDRKALLGVLAALGRAERTLAVGQRFCSEKNISPLQKLSPDWLRLADDSEDWRAFRLAAALASIRGVKGKVGPLRVHLEEVEESRRFKWSPGSTSAVWSNRPLADNLAEVFLRRWLETERAGGQGVAVKAWVHAPPGDVAGFLTDEKDDERINDLLWALIGVDWDWFARRENRRQPAVRFHLPATAIPRDFGLLRLLAEPVELGMARFVEPGKSGGWEVREGGPLKSVPTPTPFHVLGRASDRGQQAVEEAVDLAARRLWADSLVPFGWGNRLRRQAKYPAGARLDPRRLLASCLFPLSRGALTRLANTVLNPPGSET